MACNKCKRNKVVVPSSSSMLLSKVPIIKTSPDIVVLTPKLSQQTVIPQKLILHNHQSPGDILMLTAAVRDLHRVYPGKFITDIRVTCKEIWENNPFITHIDDHDKEAIKIKCDYPLVHRSNTSPYHFIHGFVQFLEEKLNLRIPLTDFKGDIYISDSEKSWISQVEEMGIKGDFWIMIAGGKQDFSAKWPDPDTMQRVVDHFKNKIQFIQTGEEKHWHPPLKNVINLIGKTDLRQFIRLIYHSVGVVCPVTFAMHAAAAVPVKDGRPRNRACVVIAGGREPVQWEAYPHHRFLSTNGALDCCDNGGCWKSRCQKIFDGDEKDKKDLCIYPVQVKHNLRIAKCIYMIKARHIIDAIEMYYEGGSLEYRKVVL